MNESARWHGKPLFEAILELLHMRGLAGGTVTRALAGFTRAQVIVTERILDLSTDLPLKVEVVDTEDAIQAVLPDVNLMIDKGLVTIEDVDVVKYTGKSGATAVAAAPRRRVTMKAKQLRVHVSEADQWQGQPLHEAILKRFLLEEFAGVTVYRAFEGFGASQEIHRAGLFSARGGAPIVLLMVDSEENVKKAIAILDGMLTHGAAFVTDVDAIFFGKSAEGKEPK
jgi:PII-like signaling protein